MSKIPTNSAADIDGAVRISLAERLSAFDIDGTLVADAQEIAEVVDEREHEVIDAFWAHYLKAVPIALRPDAAAVETKKAES
ncbi:MAG: hypothetical protein ABIV92_17640, partial [Thermoflexales bacterium]